MLHARRLLCEPRIVWPLQTMGFTGRKRARDEANPGDMPSSTHLGNWLLTQVAWGGLSAHQCQQICQLVSLDFQEAGVAAPQEITKFAALGSNGRHVNNCWRDLQTLFGANNFPLPKYITVPLVFGKRRKLLWCQLCSRTRSSRHFFILTHRRFKSFYFQVACTLLLFGMLWRGQKPLRTTLSVRSREICPYAAEI